MSQQQFDRMVSLFNTACQLSYEARNTFLDTECHGDSELRRSVEAMLAHDFDVQREDPLVDSVALLVKDAVHSSHNDIAGPDLPCDEWIGRTVGRFRIVGLLGVGGMATVFEASQDRPSRNVALKVLSATLCTPELLRRFEFEAHVLARLKHPHIAQIYEVGTLDGEQTSRPYFAMELVAGVPLSTHAKRQLLSTSQRLSLFTKVCHAVEHAHQNGVIHRDLKPANILIDHAGNPKVLDFGVARSIEIDVIRNTMHTAPGQLIGTLAYMSPEQLSAHNTTVDIRADVYALGVILFELLVERLPFDVINKPITEAARLIIEQNAPTLRTRSRAFSSDLETIVAKALEKDRDRRYPTAIALADDVDRYLKNEAILARPASTMYQLRKLVVRNKMPFAFAALLFLAMTTLAVVSTVQASRIAEARDRAIKSESHATKRYDQMRRMAHTFIFDMHDVVKDLPGATKARKFIAQTAIDYLDQIKEDAGSDASVQVDIAIAFVKVGNAQGAISFANMGETSAAINSFREAVAILEPMYQAGSQDVSIGITLSSAYEGIGEALLQHGKTDEAEEVFNKGLSVAQQLLGHAPENIRVIRSVMIQSNNLATIHTRRSQYDAALKILQESLLTAKLLSTKKPVDFIYHQDVVYAHTKIAKILREKGLSKESSIHVNAAIELMGPLAMAHPNNAELQRSLAVACIDMGDYFSNDGQRDVATIQYQRANNIYKRLHNTDSNNARAKMDLSTSCERMGGIIQAQGNLDQALVHLTRSLELREENVKSHPENASYRRELSVAHEKSGNVYLDQMHYNQALVSYERSSSLRQELATIDAGNSQLQRDLAVSYFKIGMAYAGYADDLKTKKTDRIDRWLSARKQFNRSLEHVLWMVEEGIASPSDAHIPDFLNSQIEKSNLALQLLSKDDINP